MELFEKYHNYSLKYLSYRPRSEKELRDSLIRKKAPQDIIEKIISSLKELRFINDDEFARWWVEQRSTYKPRSKYVIGLELRQKGISKDLIAKYLTEEKETAVDDLEQAIKFAQKKMRLYKNLEKQELYQKLGGALARKGFSWDVIKRAIDLTFSQER